MMRWLIVALPLAVALPGPAALPAYAAPPAGVSPSFASIPLAVGPGQEVRKDKKRKLATAGNSSGGSSNDLHVDIFDLGDLHRGETVTVTASTGAGSMICRFRVDFRQGDDYFPPDVTTDSSGNCSFVLTVPDEKRLEGKNTVLVNAYNTAGQQQGDTSETFKIRN